MADISEISLEETNKIRISLGLKPLEPPSSTAAPQVDEAGNVVLTADEEERKAVENLKALRAEQAKTAEEEALKKRLQKSRERKALNEKLSGKTLGEADGEEEDLMAWIKRTKKREKEATKKGKEVHTEEKQRDEYTSKNLEGLRVGHDIGDIQEGNGVILTLKDRGVLEDDDEDNDELVSTSLVEKERLKQNLENKIKKPKYDPYAEDYDVVTGEKKILSKYDEENQRKTFVIGEQLNDSTRDQEPSKALLEISLDYDKPLEIASDYADPSTFKIKKPKKRKNKPTNISASAILGDSILPDLPEGESMDVIPGPSTKSFARMAREEDTTADDEELQELLAQRRRQATKKRKLARPEEYIRQYQIEEENEMRDISQGGLVVDHTSEFVRGIEMTRNDSERAVSEEKPSIQDMHAMDETTEEPTEQMTDVKVEDIKEPTDTALPEPDEPAIGTSVAATLAALKRRGELQTETSKFKSSDLEKRAEILQRQALRKLELEAESRRQRAREEQSRNLSNKERERLREEQNSARDRREAMQRMQEFNEFKFNVNLEYKDEFGEEMTPKDAFKRLSHAFHGKSSGTMKRGKYLQKVQEKRVQMAGSSSIADMEKVNAQREKQKQMGAAFARIQ